MRFTTSTIYAITSVPSTQYLNWSTLAIYVYSFLLSLFFLTIYPNPPCQLPCGRKPENPEKTHDFRQSVDQLFPRVIKRPNTGFELLISEVGGSRSDD